eukprot:Hpha_TRINITY_DN16377_c2_g11::TRINITY_DN16377_c2_g11_i1::g.58137::m.58137
MSNIKVFCRARPLPEGTGVGWALGPKVVQSAVGEKRGQQTFQYDGVFGQAAETQAIYRAVQTVVARAADGYNGTIFAYGQTSSGKTHTMLGDPESGTLGVIQMGLRHLWDMMHDNVAVYKVSLAAIEVYNEQVFQLGTAPQAPLPKGAKPAPLPQLQVMVDQAGVAQLKGATPVEVPDYDAAEQAVAEAFKRRHVASTELNAHSSRSHTIIQLQITRSSTAAPTTVSQLNFVDLAGSESMKAAKTAGEQAREGKNINTSLATLVRVIKCLATKEAHAPFRDSKLTRLLEPALGGNAYTTVIACVTLAEDQFDQTLSTLRFAQKASQVTLDPKRACIAGSQPVALLDYDAEAARREEMYTKEIRVLQERLQRSRDSQQALKDRCDEQADQLTAASQQNSELTQKCEEESRAATTLRSEVAAQGEELSNLKGQYKKQGRQLEDLRTQHTASCEEATAFKAQAESEASSLKSALASEKATRKNAESRITQLEAAKKSLEEEIERAPVKELERLRGEFAREQQRRTQLEGDIANQRKALDNANKRLEGAECVNKERDERLKENERSVRMAGRELSKADRQRLLLEKDKQMVADKCGREGQRLKQTLTRLSEKESENATLRSKVNELEMQLRASERRQAMRLSSAVTPGGQAAKRQRVV